MAGYVDKIIAKLGGTVYAASKATQIPLNTLDYWKARGYVPNARITDLIERARRHAKVRLTERDFVPVIQSRRNEKAKPRARR